MLSLIRRYVYRAAKRVIYGAWPERELTDGYTILLPIPADMPFLLQLALEGFRHLNKTSCRGAIVISDGAASDDELRTIVRDFGDDSVRYVAINALDRLLVNLPRSDGSANFRHFTQILRGIEVATSTAIYLHDADAFWLEPDGVEQQYREFRDRSMYTLGVTPRRDPMFLEKGYEIPGTWELMFSNPWVRTRNREAIKGGWYPLPNGEWRWFDTLLADQYINYPSGKFGVMAKPPNLVHFYATITDYRQWLRSRHQRGVVDRSFNLLFLSMLSQGMSSPSAEISLPVPAELARGLIDETAPITYVGVVRKQYAGFRENLHALLTGPISARVADSLRSAILPFDKHYSW